MITTTGNSEAISWVFDSDNFNALTVD